MIVTALCKECSCYFRMEALEPEDLSRPVCPACEETQCLHQHVRVIPFDAGRCSQTGYHDAGEMIQCCDCGFQEVA